MHGWKFADWHAVLARHGPKLEQPLLNGLGTFRALFAQFRLHEGACFASLDQHALQGCLDRFQALRQIGLPFEPAQNGVELGIWKDWGR